MGRCCLFLYNKTTHSTCSVKQNISTGHAFLGLYPSPSKSFRSLASVSGLHDTYTILEGLSLPHAFINSGVVPSRGGSRMTTSKRFFPAAAVSSIYSVASAFITFTFDALFFFMLWPASDTALGLSSTPMTDLQWSDIHIPIVPVPQYASSTQSDLLNAAYSIAFV